jgi:hypothetical protein
VLALVLRDALLLIAIGLALGIPVELASGRLLSQNATQNSQADDAEKPHTKARTRSAAVCSTGTFSLELLRRNVPIAIKKVLAVAMERVKGS